MDYLSLAKIRLLEKYSDFIYYQCVNNLTYLQKLASFQGLEELQSKLKADKCILKNISNICYKLMCKEILTVVDTFFSKFQSNLGNNETGYYIGK